MVENKDYKGGILGKIIFFLIIIFVSWLFISATIFTFREIFNLDMSQKIFPGLIYSLLILLIYGLSSLFIIHDERDGLKKISTWDELFSYEFKSFKSFLFHLGATFVLGSFWVLVMYWMGGFFK